MINAGRIGVKCLCVHEMKQDKQQALMCVSL